MKYTLGPLDYEISDEWLAEAGLNGFVRKGDHYRFKDEIIDVFFIEFHEIEPLTRRFASVGVFCNDVETGLSARERVVRILKWFVADEEIEPVVVVPSDVEGFKYKLVAGCHRFHCAHAAGFIQVPAVLGFDINGVDSEEPGRLRG